MFGTWILVVQGEVQSFQGQSPHGSREVGSRFQLDWFWIHDEGTFGVRVVLFGRSRTCSSHFFSVGWCLMRAIDVVRTISRVANASGQEFAG